MSTPTAEDLIAESWKGCADWKTVASILAQRLASAFAEIERLRAMEAERVEPAVDFYALLRRAETVEAKLVDIYRERDRFCDAATSSWAKLAEAQQR